MSVEDFLENIQRLILDNNLNSTYKLALILAIANQAGALPYHACPQASFFEIPHREIAREFLRIYWPQARVYEQLHGDSVVMRDVLRQSDNRSNALVVSLIRNFQQVIAEEGGKLTFLRAQTHPEFEDLLRDCVARVVEKNPMRYMQGHEALFSFDVKRHKTVIARSTAILLCRFYPIIKELIMSRWEKKLRAIRANAAILSESPEGSLRDFLFFPQRAETLETVKTVLTEATGADTCFYCGRKIGMRTHADHFLPYSRFSHTRIFNFVLACDHCNCSKSDRLAAPEHLRHWIERNECHAESLIESCRERFEPGAGLVPEMALMQYRRAAGRESFWVRAGDANRSGPITVRLDAAQAAAVFDRLENHIEAMARYA